MLTRTDTSYIEGHKYENNYTLSNKPFNRLENAPASETGSPSIMQA